MHMHGGSPNGPRSPTKGKTMSVHHVTQADLAQCKADVDARVAAIIADLQTMNARLEQTIFVGENADRFADGMNATVDAFNVAQNANLQNILDTVTHNMNVVVQKLGGAPWPAPSVEQLVNSVQAASRKEDGYHADTGNMAELNTHIGAQMTAIVIKYQEIGPAIDASAWVGPEKDATAADVTAQVNTRVVPDIDAARDEMQRALQSQIDSLESTSASAGGR